MANPSGRERLRAFLLRRKLNAFGLLSIFVPFADRVCRRDPWNWAYDVAESGVTAKKTLESE